jgi:hypothetical protein
LGPIADECVNPDNAPHKEAAFKELLWLQVLWEALDASPTMIPRGETNKVGRRVRRLKVPSPSCP